MKLSDFLLAVACLFLIVVSLWGSTREAFECLKIGDVIEVGCRVN